MKRLISVILTVALLLSMLPVHALAMELEDEWGDLEDPTTSVTDDYGFTYEYDLSTQGYKVVGYSGTEMDITVPSSVNGSPVTVIGEVLDSAWAEITSVVLGDSVRIIDDNAFQNCWQLETVEMGCAVERIGSGAFLECGFLRQLTIPTTVTEIGDSAFEGCYELYTLSIPASVTQIGKNAFRGCDRLTITVDVNNPYYQSTQNCLIELETKTLLRCTGPYENLDGMVEVIGPNAFEDYENYDSDELVLPNGVITIGEDAFYSIHGLKKITMPDTVTTIGDSAFAYCYDLETINWSSNLQTIGAKAFYCTNLSSVVIPASVTSIGAGVFASCELLTSILVEEGNDAYYSKNNCLIETATKTLVQGCATGVIPDDGSVTAIGKLAFDSMYAGETLIIPGTIETVGDRAFIGCDSITMLDIRDGVKSIGDSAFSSCSGLLSVTMANSVTSLGDSAFYYCDQLSNVILSNKLTQIDRFTFAFCKSISDMVIPDRVTVIADNSFYRCTGLENLYMGAGIQTVESDAFNGCTGLKNVYYNGNNKDSVTFETGNECLTGATWENVHTHSYTSQVTTAATCTTAGVATYTCSCGDSYTEEIAATGHNYVTASWYGKPYCAGCGVVDESMTDAGSSVTTPRVCFDCGGSILTYVTPPTCTETGRVVDICPCYEDELRQIPALGHNYVDGVCAGCGDTEVKQMPIYFRPNTEWRVDDACFVAYFFDSSDYYAGVWVDMVDSNSDGVYECPAPDGYGMIQFLRLNPAVADNGWDAVWNKSVMEVLPTDGSNCFTLNEGAWVSVKGAWSVFNDCNHSFNEGVVTTAPTCISSGFKIYVCSSCGYRYTERMPAMDHSYADGVCTTCGNVESDRMTLYLQPNTEWQVDNACFTVYFFDVDNTARYVWVDMTDSNGDGVYECVVPVGYTSLRFLRMNPLLVENSWDAVWNKSVQLVLPTDGSNCFTLDQGAWESANGVWSVFNGCNHSFGEWVTESDSTCTMQGKRYHDCTLCGVRVIEDLPLEEHSYTTVVIAPTYFEQGYTVYTCSACGTNYQSDFVDPMERISLSDATLTLEYTVAYYQGQPLTPAVSLTYGGMTLTNMPEELKITYSNNNQVGTATVLVEGINMFEGSAELTFQIVYETVPEQIVNLVAIGEIGQIALSWAKSSEVSTNAYKLYRMGEGDSDFRLIAELTGRETISYIDTAVTKGQSYTYYVIGVGLYGAESEPSQTASATVLTDVTKPIIHKMSPTAATVVFGTVTLEATATDNVAVTRIAYAYSVNNGASWIAIGEGMKVSFNVSALTGQSVKVRAIAYDAEGNESEPMIVAYSLDNVGPDQVTGLSAVALTSKITLSWKDVEAQDASHFIVQMLQGENWVTVNSRVSTLGYNATGLKANTEYTFRVACVDSHNNVGEYSQPITVTTLADTVAPVITAQGPAAGKYRDAVTYWATAKDECGIASITIQISLDNMATWTDLSVMEYTEMRVSRQYSYRVSLSGYAEGSIYLRAIATDAAGNISSTGDLAPYSQYVIDRTAPDAPVGVTAVGGVGYIEVKWLAGTESDRGTFSLYRATAENGEYSCIASGLSTLNYFDRNVAEGVTYFYKLTVNDTCGNTSPQSKIVSACMLSDTEKPTVYGFTRTYDSKISTLYHTITVNASDNNQLARLVVEYCTASAPTYVRLTDSALTGHSGSASAKLPIEQLNDGEIVYLRAYAVDAAGLTSDYLTTKYTVDLTAPGVENYTASIDGNTVTLNWTDCGEADLAGFKLYRAVNGGSFSLIASMTGGKEAYSYTDSIKSTESGTYSYRLEAVDRVGNSAHWQESVSYTYVYVNKAPVAVMDTPDQMSVGVEEQFSAAGSKDDISIVSWLWDFGDGTTSEEARPVKVYETIGSYTVSLTVTDNEGLTATTTKTVEVKAREEFGTLNVTVFDDNGHTLTNFPVYFDLGEKTQRIVYTDSSGRATLRMVSGMHTVGTYADGYLPVKKDVVVLGNASRNVTLTTIEQEIVTGEFEVTRMTFDEIVAAGIDVYDPANSHVYSATVRVTYGKTSYKINFTRNEEEVLDYEINPIQGSGSDDDTDSVLNNDTPSRTFIPKVIDKNTVAILDIPAQASYLKEFFDVRLHIFNHASSEFSLNQNEVVLNVPDGMTLMTNLTSGYQTSNVVRFDSLAGQQNITLAWVLRGDRAGEYHLTADYTGVLSEFDELVSTQFVTREPIKVYGLEGVKFRILAADEIHNDTLYFNVEFENQRDIDVYLPNIDAHQWITNVMDHYQARTFLLNTYIQTENGAKQYNPVFVDADGNVLSSEMQVLAPGQKIVHEYVAYNATNYNGVSYLNDITVQCFSGIFENIEVGEFHKDRYSFKDYSEKLDRILNSTEKEVADAYDWIMDDDNYYYISEAENASKIAHMTHDLFDALLGGNWTGLTDAEQADVARQAILRILADVSTTDLTEDTIMFNYYETVEQVLVKVKSVLVGQNADDAQTTEKINQAFEDMEQEKENLAIIYRYEGSEAFREEMDEFLGAYDFGTNLMTNCLSPFEEVDLMCNVFGDMKDVVCDLFNAVEAGQRDMYYYAFLKMNCNIEIGNLMLDAIIQQEAVRGTEEAQKLKDTIETIVESNPLSPANVLIDTFDMISPELAQKLREMEDLTSDAAYDLLLPEVIDTTIGNVAKELKEQLNSNKAQFYNEAEQIQKYMLQNVMENLVEKMVQALLQKAIGSTVLAVVTVAFSIADAVFGFSMVKEQERALLVYANLTEDLIKEFQRHLAEESTGSDLYAMLYLRAICEIRLGGEAQLVKFIQDRLEKIPLPPQDENDILKEISSVCGRRFISIDAWVDYMQYMLVSSRDILFNKEFSTELASPNAPFVSLDYENLQTHQNFSSLYEYCFADGEWKDCTDAPITFEVGVVPGTLRVRVRATETSLAGQIKTVKIFAQKELSKLIDVKFDGTGYLVDDLSSDYYYQIIFTNDPAANVNWNYAKTIAGSNDLVTVSGYGEYDYAIIRSCSNPDKQETTSVPLVVTVDKKHPLNLVISGSGTVTQSDAQGIYYYGDTIDLMAQPMTGNTFEGWYIDGVCVSQDVFYVLEMAEDVQITAVFTGAQIESVSIAQLPNKLQYMQGEALDLTGIELLVTYADGTTASLEPDTAYFKSMQIGQTQVIVSFGGFTAEYDVQIVTNPAATMPTAELDFSTVSLSLYNDMTVRLKVDGTLFTQAGFEDPYVVCEMNGYTFIIDAYTIVDGNYMFAITDINPAQINDRFTATLCGQFNGRTYSSEPLEYSVAQYCYSMLEKKTGDEHAALRTLLVDLLNYGSAAQKYTGHSPEVLANAALTEQQAQWGTATLPTLNNVFDKAYATVQNATAAWMSVGLALSDTVALRFRLAVDNPEGITVKMVGESGMELVITSDQLKPAKNGTYYAEFDDVMVLQMCETMYVTVYRGDEAISDTLRYSIESYACEKQNDANEALSALVDAMMKYGNAAKAYVEQA